MSHKPRCVDARRWSAAPVIERVGVGIIYERYGSSSKEILRNGFTDRQADQISVAIGLHPCLLWPDWFTAGLSVVDAQRTGNGWRNAFIYSENVRGNDV